MTTTTTSTDPAGELRQLRAEVERLEAEVRRLEAADLSGSVSLAAKVVAGGHFPAAGAVGMTYQVAAADVAGAEAEGVAGVITARPGTFLAVCLSATLPIDGQETIVHQAGGAWVFLV